MILGAAASSLTGVYYVSEKARFGGDYSPAGGVVLNRADLEAIRGALNADVGYSIDECHLDDAALYIGISRTARIIAERILSQVKIFAESQDQEFKEKAIGYLDIKIRDAYSGKPLFELLPFFARVSYRSYCSVSRQAWFFRIGQTPDTIELSAITKTVVEQAIQTATDSVSQASSPARPPIESPPPPQLPESPAAAAEPAPAETAPPKQTETRRDTPKKRAPAVEPAASPLEQCCKRISDKNIRDACLDDLESGFTQQRIRNRYGIACE